MRRSASPQPRRRPPGAPRPFAPGGYEILDARLKDEGEVMLWSVGGPAPRCGELFTIARGDGLCDLSVVQVTGHDPGWSALCRRVEPPI